MSRKKRSNLLGLILALILSPTQALAQGFEGYYQQPDLHGNTLVFVAEGDLWKVPVTGGLAQRLTTHTEVESHPAISPDGSTIAYSATYEGPREVYTLPMDGGIPTRWTYSEGATVRGWTPDGKIIYETGDFNKLPTAQLVTLDLTTKQKAVVPLHQASEGSLNQAGAWLFVRPPAQYSTSKRYVGGWARQIWQFDGQNEAVKLTTDYPGESFNPMWYENRVYFITDRDGIKNIWSMDANEEDLMQHTEHKEFDVRYANLDQGRIIYQHGADLWLLDLASGEYEKIDIRLASDMAQLREQWVENPAEYITAVHPDSTGEKIVITARGRVFVVPVNGGRSVYITEHKGVRFRDAIFSPDGLKVVALSDESGEFEFVQFAADGKGDLQPLTKDSTRLRYQGIPSPDGKWIAYDDLEKNMYVLNVASGISQKISTNQEGIRDFSWSPDGQWLAFVQEAMNTMAQIKVYNVNDESLFDLTTDRANSFNPCWSPDGKFIYFLSDRSFRSLVNSPGDVRQPDPYFDANDKIYHVALQAGTRSPFREKDELMQEEAEDSDAPMVVNIDQAGIQARLMEVPIPAGNYRNLAINEKALYLIASETGVGAKSQLKVVKITDEDAKLADLASEVSGFELTADGKKLLVRKGRSYFMVEAGTGSVNLSEGNIDLSGWSFAIDPGKSGSKCTKMHGAWSAITSMTLICTGWIG